MREFGEPGERRAIALAIVAVTLGILWNSLQRTHLGLGAESDFTGMFGPEAQRILSGEPLWLYFHPPAYSFAVALARLATDGWLAAGLWISAISAAIVLIASVLTFRRLGGSGAAWGALVGCACSVMFLRYASAASSDMLFAALMGLALLLVVEAMHGGYRAITWASMGVVTALVVLTRTNGIAAALILAVPLATASDWPQRLRSFIATLGGFLALMIAWAAYAQASGSPFMPTKSFILFAVAAYSTGPGAMAEEFSLMASQFDSMAQVLAYDPVHILSQIAKRFVALPRELYGTLTWKPLAVLAAPGVWVMWRQRRSRAWLVYLSIMSALVGLTAIKAFEGRFFLVLVPLVGALAGMTVASVIDRIPSNPSLRATAVVLLACGLTFIAWLAHNQALRLLESKFQSELAEAIPQIRRHTEPDAALYARKDNIAFEIGRRAERLPNVATVAALRAELCARLDGRGRSYLYFGSAERHYRGALAAALAAAPQVPWLVPIAAGRETSWTLYRIMLFDADLPAATRCP